MKNKLFNIVLVLTSLMAYLEWGKGNHSFLLQIEADLFRNFFTRPSSIIHPFTIVPILGQMILILSLVIRNPGKIWTYIGMVCIGLLLVFMLVIGIISMNYKISISTLPFILTSVFILRFHRSEKK